MKGSEPPRIKNSVLTNKRKDKNMYYIGIKQRSFNADYILSENSAHWLTYFNPDSKLKFQTAKHWNNAGVKKYADEQQAINLMHEVQDYGIKECFVAQIEKDQAKIVKESSETAPANKALQQG